MTNAFARRAEFFHADYPELWTALAHHRTHKNKPITFEKFAYLKDIYLDRADTIIVKKSTQVGATEWLTIRAITAARHGRGVFYVLPTYSLVGRFVKNRIDRSIENTPLYKASIGGGADRRKFAESTSLKHIGTGSIAFVGSNSTSGFTEYPADDLIIDELDECDASNLSMAWERLSASPDKRIIKSGNPTVKGYGIDAEYAKSDRKTWQIPCECGTWTEPDWFENVVEQVDKGQYVLRDKDWTPASRRDIHMVCRKCERPLDRYAAGRWTPGDRSQASGYTISKLFASAVKLRELLERFEAGLTDDSKMQRFYNGDLGLAYTAAGSRIRHEDLDACVKDYALPDSDPGPCVIGIDVGVEMHVCIFRVLPEGRSRAVFIGTAREEGEIVDLCKRYGVKAGCVDAMPEGRLSRALCSKVRGMFRVFYGDVKRSTIDSKNRIATVDRTVSLDEVKEMILTQAIELPRNARGLAPVSKEGVSDFYYHIGNSTRVYDEDKAAYRWTEGSLPDHFLHSLNYMQIARKIFTAFK